MIDLPQGWEWKKLSEFTDIIMGQSPASSSYNEEGIGLPFFQGKAEFGAIYPKVKKWCSEPTKIAEKGDVLLSVRAPVGPTNICPEKACIGRGLSAIRGKNGISSFFLLYLLRAFQPDLEKEATGTTFEAVTGDKVRNLILPLPPLDEQQRIVARIEELFTQLDAGVAALEAVRGQVRRYRQAVLQAAFEGKLSSSWRIRDQDGKHQPTEWYWKKVKEVGKVQLGRQRAPQHHNGPYMRPYLRVANVFEDRIDTTDVMEMNFSPEEYETYKLKNGDILLNEGQSPEFLGRPAIYRDQVPGACFQNTLIRFQAYSDLLPEFALIIFRHYMHSGRFQKLSQITTNIAHLSAGRFAEIEFPLPSLAEQVVIVDEVESRLSSADQLGKSIDQSLRQAARLRQSILSRAFWGALHENG